MTVIKFSVSLYSISQLAFLMKTSRVLCEVRSERLYRMLNDFGLQKIKLVQQEQL
jgi:hypothetical protein